MTLFIFLSIVSSLLILVFVLWIMTRESTSIKFRVFKIVTFTVLLVPMTVIICFLAYLEYAPEDLVELRNKGELFNSYTNNTQLITTSNSNDSRLIDKIGRLKIGSKHSSKGLVKCYLLFKKSGSDWEYRITFVESIHQKAMIVKLGRLHNTYGAIESFGIYEAEKLYGYVRNNYTKHC